MALQQFVLLPREGLRATDPSSQAVLMSLPFVSSPEPPLLAELPIAPGGTVRVHDTVERGGPQLVEMDATAAQVLNAQAGPVRAFGDDLRVA
jgi:hypothetical protein